MWLYIAGLALATLGVMDLLVNIVAVRLLNFTPVELGLLNALWTAAVIPSLRHSNLLSNAGLTKRPTLIGFLAFAAFIPLFYLSVSWRSAALLYTAYVLHAVTYSYVKTGCQTAVLESYPSHQWSHYSRRLAQLAVLFEGLLLLGVSRVWSSLFETWYFQLIAVFVLAGSALLVLVVPQPSLRFEKILTRIESHLKKSLTRIHGYLTISSLDYANGEKVNILIERFVKDGVSLTLIAAALAAFRIGNEYLFTPLPFVFIRLMGLKTPDVIALYGLGKAIGFTVMLVLPPNVVSKGAFTLAALVKVASVAGIVFWRPDLGFSSVLLAAIYISNLVIDTTIYTLYVTTTSGSNVGLFNIVAEASSLVGTLTSGFVMTILGLDTTVLLLVILNLVPLLLVKKSW
ncbi:hypothetical protein [Thermogladius sp.]|uniref:hypothetical protein n=1 Tax=Thermogladius sp. TaxID=2023064 RepID=UPI003D104B55